MRLIRLFVSIIFALVAPINSAPNDGPNKHANTPIDLRTQTVGKISPKDSLETIKSKVGEKNIESFVYEQEGNPYTAYIVTFKSGSKANLYLSHFEISTPDFRTKEGLGVGSTLEEFKKVYEDGELSWMSDGFVVWSEKHKFRLYFSGFNEPSPKDKVERIHVNRSIVRW